MWVIWAFALLTCMTRLSVPWPSLDKRRKLAWFRHVTCHNSCSKAILKGTLEDGRHSSWQRKCWMDNMKEWTFLPMPELRTVAFCSKDWKRINAELCDIPPNPFHQGTEVNFLSLHLDTLCNQIYMLFVVVVVFSIYIIHICLFVSLCVCERERQR